MVDDGGGGKQALDVDISALILANDVGVRVDNSHDVDNVGPGEL